MPNWKKYGINLLDCISCLTEISLFDVLLINIKDYCTLDVQSIIFWLPENQMWVEEGLSICSSFHFSHTNSLTNTPKMSSRKFTAEVLSQILDSDTDTEEESSEIENLLLNNSVLHVTVDQHLVIFCVLSDSTYATSLSSRAWKACDATTHRMYKCILDSFLEED